MRGHPYYPPQSSTYLARAGAGEQALEGRLGVTEHTIYSDYLEEQGVTYVLLAGAVDTAEAVLPARWPKEAAKRGRAADLRVPESTGG